MMKILTTTAAAILAATTAAHAGGLAPAAQQSVAAQPAPEVVPAAPVSHDWTGFYVGIQGGDSDYTFTADSGSVTEAALEEVGLHAGYLHDLGQFVVGGEVSFSQINSPGFAHSGHDMEITRYKLIAGYDLGSFLPYVAAGTNKNIYVPEDLEVSGITYSLGVEYKLFDHVLLGAEYADTQYDNDPVIAGTGSIAGILLRASYKF